MIDSGLPIDEVLPELLNSFRTHPNCVLHAPPGAGKTTRVPLALLDLVPPHAGRIIILEPRRLAAVSAARFMADQLHEPLGQTVGYSIRFDSKTSAATRIEVVTEAILTRRIQNDPLLEGVAMIIFDEFHERSIQADLGLALSLDVQRQVREDLHILVMSATLECSAVARLMGGAPVITCEGRMFPVREIFVEEGSHGPLAARMGALILRGLAETEGDLLAFLPGAGEIRGCYKFLTESGLKERGIGIHQLYGDLPFERQQAALMPGKARKIVLATNIAETSLTIEGVKTVIDCGLSRRVRHDPARGMNRLVTVRESKSSAEQRRGRAGRLSPGVCYRMFSRHTFNAMTPHTAPEILESDLSPLFLELAAWGATAPGDLSWLDTPPEASLASAGRLLHTLSALDGAGRITALGASMANLPLHPRLSRMVLRACDMGYSRLGCDLAALLSERDVVRRTSGPVTHTSRNPDMEERLQALVDWRRTGRCAEPFEHNALVTVDRVARQVHQLVTKRDVPTHEQDSSDVITRLLLAAYPDRIGRLRGSEPGKFLLSNGRGARLAVPRQLNDSPFIVAVSVDGGDQSEGVIHLSQALDECLLREELSHCIEQQERVIWEQQEGRMISVREERLGALLLTTRPTVVDPARLVPVVLEAVRDSQLSLLEFSEVFLQFQARIKLLLEAFPDDGWPDFSNDSLIETLEQWLKPALLGVRTRQQLASLKPEELLLTTFDYARRQALEVMAPTHLIVPSGSRIKLDYCQGEKPVLAVKLQELFGLPETPTIARGRVAVVLHLLSPAGRPLQVTQDLRGFWDGTYHQVKKEMKGRYPKHPWPDDPWNAVPTRRAKPRGT